jgi:hypothetical protein
MVNVKGQKGPWHYSLGATTGMGMAIRMEWTTDVGEALGGADIGKHQFREFIEVDGLTLIGVNVVLT